MRFAENGREGECEDLVVEIVADMHDPVAPVFRVSSHDQRADDAGCAVSCLGEVSHRFAVSIDPAFPGAVRSGTVGVFVIARRHPKDAPPGPPVDTSQTLAVAAAHLANQAGPLGARIVTANPRFHEVIIQATITVAAGRDAGAAMSAAGDALDAYLNPERGSWSIGATLRHSRLVHIVLGADPDIVSVPYLSLTVDGIAQPACADAALSRFGLPWPGRHRLLAEAEEIGP